MTSSSDYSRLNESSADTPIQNNILHISRQNQGYVLQFPYHICLFKMAPSKANPPLSPANGSRSMILPPNIVENPTYHVRTDSLKPLQSPVIAPHSPDMEVWGFPLTSGLCSCQLHLSPSVEWGGGGGGQLESL